MSSNLITVASKAPAKVPPYKIHDASVTLLK